MGKRGSDGSSLVNLGLVVFGLGVLLLLYAFVTGSFVTSWGTEADPEREDNPADLVGDIIQVDVRNGCGVPGLATRMTDYLRDRGFDVVEMGNYTSFDQQETVVLDRVGDSTAAHRVAAALGLPEDRVRQEIRPEYYLDASIIIGADYETLKPFEEREEE